MQHSEVRNRLLKAIDKAVNGGQWQGSLFYKNILKQLVELRSYVVSKLGERIIEDPNEADVAIAAAKTHLQSESDREAAGYEKVYVSLYQAESERMDRWLNTIKLLPEHYVSRPIYRQLEHMQEMIRAKASRTEAYAIVWVKTVDIVPHHSGITKHDRFGHELLSLKSGSIELENLVEFIHDGRSYRLIENQLIVKED